MVSDKNTRRNNYTSMLTTQGYMQVL
jgi:hypothetical protein